MNLNFFVLSSSKSSHIIFVKIVILRVAGVEGIILDLEGNHENTFEWGLGRASNNQAKALVLFQGLRIIDENHIKRIIVIGDLILIIKLMLRSSFLSDGKLIRTKRRIKKEVTKFEIVEFLHILRNPNQKANPWPTRPFS
jgi:ribonuclease HI